MRLDSKNDLEIFFFFFGFDYHVPQGTEPHVALLYHVTYAFCELESVCPHTSAFYPYSPRPSLCDMTAVKSGKHSVDTPGDQLYIGGNTSPWEPVFVLCSH
jgi:hypothetical protein